MLPIRLSLFALLLALACPASAQEYPGPRAAASIFPQGFDQAVYKGVLGNALDAIPMDPSKRLELQRTNAVVGNALLGRSLAVLAGLSNPVLLLGGLAWGMWAASNIKPAAAAVAHNDDLDQAQKRASAQARAIALLDRSLRADEPAADLLPEPFLLSAISAEDWDHAAELRPQVVRIWLPQNSPLPPR
jgi:hypothetical protein